jgi:hypothetical protein
MSKSGFLYGFAVVVFGVLCVYCTSLSFTYTNDTGSQDTYRVVFGVLAGLSGICAIGTVMYYLFGGNVSSSSHSSTLAVSTAAATGTGWVGGGDFGRGWFGGGDFGRGFAQQPQHAHAVGTFTFNKQKDSSGKSHPLSVIHVEDEYNTQKRIKYPTQSNLTNEERAQVMKPILWKRFHNTNLTGALLDTTDNKRLVMRTTEDKVWGINKDGEGQNLFGKYLEQLRQVLRDGGSERDFMRMPS